MTKVTRLNDLQMILLSTASARPDGNLLPLPDSIAGDRDRAGKAMAPMLKHGLVEKRATANPSHRWQDDTDGRIGLFITKAGISLIAPEADSAAASDIEIDEPASLPTLNPSGKTALVLDLLHRDDGASIDELIAVTGWLPHTTRAALTGLRKKGHVVVREKIDGTTRYLIKLEVAE